MNQTSPKNNKKGHSTVDAGVDQGGGVVVGRGTG